jgi:nitrite reductase/ring-hydroxylating ferredoxin subunit
MALVDVGAVEDFPEGKVRVVTVQQREVGVVAWRGTWFAVRNICPHLGAPVCEGELWPMLSQDSVDAELRVEHDRPLLMCPWHRWEFDVSTGACVTGRERLKTHAVQIEDGRVLVDAKAARPVATG